MATPIDQYIGSHATDAAVVTYLSARSWTVQEGWLYHDSTLAVLKIYNGTEWVALWPKAGGPTSFKSFSFDTHAFGTGVYFAAGYYMAPAADANLTQAAESLTKIYGTSNSAYGAHAFIVAAGAGTTDAGTVSIVVSGTSITDAGVRTAADSETIVADVTAMATDDYAETAKKWIGTIIYTITPAGGAATYAFSFNYGFAKYEDYGNRDFTVTDFEAIGMGGAADSTFDVELLLHSDAGWTYSAAAFAPGGSVICSSKTDYVTEDELKNGEYFAYKRAGLTQDVEGTAHEGVIVRITVGQNNSIEQMDLHIGVTA